MLYLVDIHGRPALFSKEREESGWGCRARSGEGRRNCSQGIICEKKYFLLNYKTNEREGGVKGGREGGMKGERGRKREREKARQTSL